MNPFLDGEADAYAKRNAGLHAIEPWFLALLETIKFKTVVDMGGGDGWRSYRIVMHIPEVVHAVSVDAASGSSWDTGRIAKVANQDVETYDIPECDLCMFNYVLHWLPRADEVLDRAMRVAKHILINDFYPSAPLDVPYAHREGIVTRKRRYGERIAAAGWKLHAAVSYHYHQDIDAEWCRCEIWSKP